MAKQVAAEESVFKAADELVAEGADPSLKNVQERTGGSYTTVKRFLEIWEEARKSSAAQPIDVPADFEAKGREFARILYVAAFNQVHAAAMEQVAAAHAELASVRGKLSGAEAEVSRLEGIEQGQLAQLELNATRIHELELRSAADVATLESRTMRITQLENELTEARSDLSASDQELAGLRAQIADSKGVEGLQSALAAMQERLDAFTPPANGTKAKK